MRFRAEILALPLVLGACVQSIHPLYTDGTLVREPALAGTWVAESGDVLVVATSDSVTFAITLLDQDGEVSQWVGRVTLLEGRRWLDVEPAELPDQWSDGYRGSFLPTHQFWHLARVDSLLITSGLEYDSLKAVLERDPSAVTHVGLRNGVVLSAPTAALRTFIAGFADRPGTLGVSETLRRVRRPR